MEAAQEIKMENVNDMLKNLIISFAIGAVVLFGLMLIIRTLKPL